MFNTEKVYVVDWSSKDADESIFGGFEWYDSEEERDSACVRLQSEDKRTFNHVFDIPADLDHDEKFEAIDDEINGPQ